MHPVIRIVTCISFIFTIASATWPVLVFFSLVVLGFSLVVDREAISKTIRMAWRLKWLMLSILVLYLWWTPGQPLSILGWHMDSAWWPSSEGFILAAHRVGVLLLIIFSVQLLLIRSSINELIAALDWLVTPLRWFGITTAGFALRCALTIKELPGIRQTVRESMQASNQGRPFARMVTFLTVVYDKSVTGRTGQPESIEVPHIEPPGLAQWLLPVAILLVPVLMNMLRVIP